MLKMILKIFRYFRYLAFNSGENHSCDHFYSHESNPNFTDAGQAEKELKTLLLFAERLSELMMKVIRLLKSGQLYAELEFIKSELRVLDRQFSRLSPLVVSYEKGMNGQRDDDLVSSNLINNLIAMSDILASSDIVLREFTFASTKGVLIFIDGLTDKETINNDILSPLLKSVETKEKRNPLTIDSIQRRLLSASDVKKFDQLNDVKDNVLSGGTALLVDGLSEALIVNATKWESRGVEKPELENVIRGPREGFSENVQINTSLIRRKIRNTHLRFEKFTIGTQTRSNVWIAYMSNMADEKLVEEIKIRLARIHTDAVLDSGYIEAFIEDAPYSVFATIANSEKPDVVAAKILEGRVAILVDGSPIVLTVPSLFIESFQSPEDYYVRPYYGSLLRLVRLLSYVASLFSPAVYVSLITFHQELIPTPLLITLAAGRIQVPFPAVFEALAIGVVFEILREAGVRMPRPVGSAVSIVGALVIGQTAVAAGLISPIMVIVVGITAIASFAIPVQADSGTILRFILLLSAGIAGGFGILMVTLVILLHLASLRSFGTPFLSPLAPLSLPELKDSFIRVPLWAMTRRPEILRPYANTIRQSIASKPYIPGKDKRRSSV